jgi:PKD-like domain/Ig-like domain CHU_C associated/Lysyl oxidase
MRNITLAAGILLLSLPFQAQSQCSTTNATSCVCETVGSTNCDLLPDIIVARPPLLVQGTSGIIEYSQTGNGAENGRLRISVSTPNIGRGPLEVRTTTTYVCGTDTIVGTAPATCLNTGLPPKQLVIQRVYHKNGNTMTYTDRPAGSMTYHPSHGHMHVDDWGVYSLRSMDSTQSNPLNWPIIGTGAKLAFCLMDYGSCSTYGGHCVDSAGNTLLNGNFPNYGLGGGQYNCSSVVQGISSGYTDIYYQHLDGMYINIPPGVCNGQYYIVVNLDPYNYFLEEDETNNVLVVPYTLTQQVTGTVATITSNRSGAICSSDNITLTANGGAGYSYLWSNGATTQSITTQVAGNYAVTVTSACGVAFSAPYTVTVSTLPPVTTGASVCGTGSDTLEATSAGSTIKWYAAASGGSSLFTGNAFVPPPVGNTTSWYAEATSGAPGFNGYAQPTANTIGAGGYTTGAQYLIFDAYQSFTLHSVKVYAQSAGNRTVELRSSTGSLLNTITTSVPAGQSRIVLNWAIPAGSDYRLTRAGSTDLYRNSAGVTYPYTLPGILSIKNSSAGNSYYYFFYDWEVSTASQTCTSSRVPATLTVNPVPVITTSGNTSVCAGSSATLSAGGATTYAWSPSAGLNGTSGATTIATPSSTTTYTVTGTNGSGCTSSDNITVTVNPLPVVSLAPFTALCDTGTATLLTGGSPAGGTWSGPFVSGGSFNQTAAGAGQHTVVYSYTDGNNCSASAQAVITVNDCNCAVLPTPVKNVVGLSKPCPGSTGTYTMAAIAGATSYTWTVPQDVTILSGQGTSGISVSFGPNFVSGSVCVTANNACGPSGQKCRTVSRNISPTPSAFTGNLYGNCGSPVALNVNTISTATSYTWTPPAGSTNLTGQGTNAVTFNLPSGFVSGQVCVTSFNGCMNSLPRCNTVYSAPKKPTAITGPNTVCVGQQNVSYSVAPAYGATTYWWVVPSGSTIVSGAGTNSIVVNFGANGGNVTCSARNSCGNQGTRALAVSMNCRTGNDLPELNARIQPNPASGYAELIIEQGGTSVEVVISNLLGKDLMTVNYDLEEGAAIPLDLSGYAKGFYLVSVRTGGQLKTIRLVVD